MSSDVVSSYDNFWYVLRLLHNYLSTFKVKFTLVKEGFIDVSVESEGSIQISGKLPTYPSPNPTFFPKWEVSVTVDLGEG